MLPIAQAVREAYARGEEDEQLLPLVAVDESGEPLGRIKPGDCVFFYDIRGEREVELSRSFTEKDFKEFPVMRGLNPNYLTMIEYAKSLGVRVAFPPERIEDTLCSIVSQHGESYEITAGASIPCLAGLELLLVVITRKGRTAHWFKGLCSWA